MFATHILSMALAAAAPAAVHQYGDLAIAPKGDRMVSVETRNSHAVVVVRAVGDGHVVATLDPCATCSYADPVFATDGTLAFVARDRTAGTATLDIVERGNVRSLAVVSGLASTPRFSPDGTYIALLVTIGATKETGARQAGARQIGEIGERSDEQRLAIFARTAATVTGDAIRPVSPPGRYIYEYSWTPDGRGFVVTSALGNGDANWWVATLDAIEAGTGAVRRIAAPATQINQPQISPDGATVGYIGGLMSDFGSVGGDVWTVPFVGGTPVDRTKGAMATVTALDWTPGGLRATRLAGADMQVARVDPAGRTDVAWQRAATLSAGMGRVAFADDGATIATVVQDFTHAPAIFAGAIAGPRQVTHDNDALTTTIRAKSVTWTNKGFTNQGWLLAPDMPGNAQAPMITIVHGGPAAANTPAFVNGGTTADLLAHGYYLFLPNPRGSYGQGEAFTAANRRDFGGGDLGDILAGIDAVERIAPVDDARLGLTGGSYGGFMAMWANTQTNRFKAIVAAAGLSDWISYYGTNGINEWMIPYFGASAYDDPAAYRAVSAIDFIKRAHTPTFIYVGERDIEVPPTQSVEYWNALKAMRVPTSLVIYPDEGHGLHEPRDIADARARTIAWFDRYLAAR